MDYNDKFDKWNDRKKEIQIKKDKRIKIGKVYWISIGQNIGSEIYGKGDEFIRPVLVLNKIYIKDYINLFIGIPLSSQVKNKQSLKGKMYNKKIGIYTRLYLELRWCV